MRTFLIAFAILSATSLSALAHSPLKSTLPADGAQLDAVPEMVTLMFTKAARLTKVTQTHNDKHNERLDLPSKKFQKTFEIQSASFGAGTYRIDWRALSKDGHPLKGSFVYSIAE